MNKAAGFHRLLRTKPERQRQRLGPLMAAHEAEQGDLDDIHTAMHFLRQWRQLHTSLFKETQFHVALGCDDPSFGFGHDG